MTHKKSSIFLLLAFILSLAAYAGTPSTPEPNDARKNPLGASVAVPAPPRTSVNEVKDLLYGTEIVDPYRWLEDQNSPETRAWIDAQNAYTDSLLAKLPEREALRRQVGALIKIDTMGSPLVTGGRYFFTRRGAEQDQSSLFMRKGLTGPDELLVPDVLVDRDGLVGAAAAAGERHRGLLLQPAGHGTAAAVTGGGQVDVDRLPGRERLGSGDHDGGDRRGTGRGTERSLDDGSLGHGGGISLAVGGGRGPGLTRC